MTLRRSPEVVFIFDQSVAAQDRVEQILQELKQERTSASRIRQQMSESSSRSRAPPCRTTLHHLLAPAARRRRHRLGAWRWRSRYARSASRPRSCSTRRRPTFFNRSPASIASRSRNEVDRQLRRRAHHGVRLARSHGRRRTGSIAGAQHRSPPWQHALRRGSTGSTNQRRRAPNGLHAGRGAARAADPGGRHSHLPWHS